MYKKISTQILLGLFISTLAFNSIAASDNSSQNGFFFGAESGISNINYPITYNVTDSSNYHAAAHKETLQAETPAFFVLGTRYYLPFSNPALKKLGFGFKGWFGVGSHSYSGDFTATTTAGNEVTESIKVTADAMRYGAEGQIYYDFSRFKFLSKNSNVGLQLGVGYELIDFSNIKYTFPNEGEFTYSASNSKSKKHDDKSITYSAGLYFSIGQSRIDVGYKQYNYSAVMNSRIYQGYNNIIGINPKNAIYATYTLTL